MGIGSGSAEAFRMSETTVNPVACEAHLFTCTQQGYLLMCTYGNGRFHLISITKRGQKGCGASGSRRTSPVTRPLPHVSNDNWIFYALTLENQENVCISCGHPQRHVDTQVASRETTAPAARPTPTTVHPTPTTQLRIGTATSVASTRPNRHPHIQA